MHYPKYSHAWIRGVLDATEGASMGCEEDDGIVGGKTGSRWAGWVME